MADLIIKPAAQSGNKVIIQDQAGGAVLTTADSGIDASTSTVATKTGTETLTNKTLNSPTMVTPALGTPASGVATNLTGIPAANLSGTLAAARLPADNLKTFKHLERGWNGIPNTSWGMGYIWHNASNKWGTTGTGPTGATFTPSAGITKTYMIAKFKAVGYQTSSGTSNFQFSVRYEMYLHTAAISAGTTYNSHPNGPGTLINNKSTWAGRDDYIDWTGPSGSDTWHHFDITTIWPITGLTPGTTYYVHMLLHNPGGSGTSSPTITMGMIESLTFFEYS